MNGFQEYVNTLLQFKELVKYARIKKCDSKMHEKNLMIKLFAK